jgi:plastocyanin
MGGKRWVLFTLIGLLCTVGLAGCGDGDDDEDVVGLVKATEMSRFVPDTLSARVGEEVNFTLQNDDEDRQHNVTVSFILIPPEMNPLSVDVGPKQTRTVRFTINQRPPGGANFLTFFCRFHQAEGMQAKINLR